MTGQEELTLRGRRYRLEGPSPRYGTWLLTGAKGATYITAQAYVGDPDTLKVVGLRGHELRLDGQRVLLRRTPAGGLEEVGILRAAAGRRTPG
jgi:hypothetical protein